VKYLVDANLPRALAGWLASDGDEAFYVDDLLAPPAADDGIWALAAARELIIVSKDADFAARAARDHQVRVVWIRCGNLKLRAFEAWIDARRAALRRQLDDGERLVELR
jgi:predicted nuclease of predicted toxin-antitoxin system